MNGTRFICAFGTVLVGMAATAGTAHVLHYESAAENTLKGWEQQSLPIGNGWFGANVFGGVEGERVQITENSVLTRKNLTDALEVYLTFPGFRSHGAVRNYRRELDIDRGVAKVEFDSSGVRFTREFFASYPDRVLVMRLTAARPGALNFGLEPEIPFQRPFGIGREAICGRTGSLKAKGSVLDVTQHLQYYNVKFFGRFAVKTDGVLETLDHTIDVKKATEAVIVFSCGTNYRLSPEVFCAPDGDFSKPGALGKLTTDCPAAEIAARADAALAKGWDRLLADHVRDFSGLMGRCSVDLPNKGCESATPTDRLIARCGDGERSSYLEELYFQYGRYLLVSSSRPGTLPANLQGTWTGHDKSPWGSGYWHNINVQMNYWPAFSCNLAECFQAYADFNAAFRPSTRGNAIDYLRNHGLGPLPKDGEAPDIWCVGTAVYPYFVWGGPGGHSGPGTGALTTKLFAEWWDYTRDDAALKDYGWPVIHGMADFLTRCVTETNGLYLSKFSASPEQQIRLPDGGYGSYYTTVGCAFDQQMMWENGNDLLRFAKILGVEDDVVKTVRRQIDRYDPVQIGGSGQIKEFREEDKYGEIGEYHHRHISHLVGLYPGTLINKNHPDWMAAARVALTERGDESTGWALAHRLNCWARLGDGEHCLKLIRNLLGKRTYANLWDAHPPFQIDGNFGATSGIAEMLLQSHAGYIDLLPALPKAWASEGSFRGLCARGAVEVDCAWKDGQPVRVVLRPKKGLVPEVRFAGTVVAKDLIRIVK